MSGITPNASSGSEEDIRKTNERLAETDDEIRAFYYLLNGSTGGLPKKLHHIVATYQDASRDYLQGMLMNAKKQQTLLLETLARSQGGGGPSSDESLQEFLDDVKLDDPAAPHREIGNHNSFIEWGRKRSQEMLLPRGFDMPFTGRDTAVDALIDHALEVIATKNDRQPIKFMHASPGLGKTRLVCEVVVMDEGLVARQLERLSSNKTLNESTKTKFKENLLSLLPIAISFNTVTSFGAYGDDPADGLPETAPFALRAAFMWLSTCGDYAEFIAKVKRCVEKGLLLPELLRIQVVLQLIAERSNKLYPYLFVDETTKARGKFASGRDVNLARMVQELAVVQDRSLFNDKGKAVVAFTALRVGIFAKVKTTSNRTITGIPLRLLSYEDTKYVLLTTIKQDLESAISRMGHPKPDFAETLDLLAMLCGGHMRACEAVISALRVGNTYPGPVQLMCNAFDKFQGKQGDTDLYSAAVLSLLGKEVSPNSKCLLSDNMNATVEDLIENGQLMTSISDLEDRNVVPQMPLVSLVGWAESCRKGTKVTKDRSLTEAICDIFYTMFREHDPGRRFEWFGVLQSTLMRAVLKNTVDGSLTNPTNINWKTDASLENLYSPWCGAGPIDKKFASLRFDATTKLDITYTEDATAEVQRCFVEKVECLCFPKQPNYPSIDYFTTLKAVNEELVAKGEEMIVVATQAKFSSETSTTGVSETEVNEWVNAVFEKMKKIGIPKESVFVMCDLWRDRETTIRISAPNAVVRARKQLEEAFGPTLSDLLRVADRVTP